MCWEAIQIGRATQSEVRTVTLGANIVQVARARADRIALILFPHSTSDVRYFPSEDEEIGTGLAVGNDQYVTVVSIQEWGDLARRAWGGIADAPPATVMVAEVFLTQTKEEIERGLD